MTQGMWLGDSADAANRPMARLSAAFSLTLLLVALGLGYVRHRVTSIKRHSMADQTEMELTRPGGQVWYDFSVCIGVTLPLQTNVKT